MSNLTKADISQIVRNALSSFQSEISTIRDAVQRVDQRTNDLDDTQREVKELYQHLQQLAARLERVAQQVQAGDAHAPMRTQNTQDTKLRVQNIERGIAEIVQYMHANHHKEQSGEGYQQ